MISADRRAGPVLTRRGWADRVNVIREGIARDMSEPGPCASENLKPGGGGRFLDVCCNRKRIPECAGEVTGQGWQTLRLR